MQNWYLLFKEASRIHMPFNLTTYRGEFLGKVMALSPSQAVEKAIRGWGDVDRNLVEKCRTRHEMGIEIVAFLDKYEWTKIQQDNKEKASREQQFKQEKEDKIKKMWWNND